MVQLRTPPLRECPEDTPGLAQRFLGDCERRDIARRLGIGRKSLRERMQRLGIQRKGG